MTTTAKKQSSGSTSNAKVNTFHQRLGSLTYHQACQMLGDDGGRLLRVGNRFTEIEEDEGVFLGGDLLRIRMRDCESRYNGPDDTPEALIEDEAVIVTMTLQSARSKQILVNCDHCDAICYHSGAALSYLLDSKSALGLAAPPDESVPIENLTSAELIARGLAERAKRADEESMRVRSGNAATPWADYVVTSDKSGKSYRVALRGTEPFQSYCSCPDFRTNRLGTCKHILHVIEKVKKRFRVAELDQPYQRKQVSIGLHYGEDFGLRFHLPAASDETIEEIAGRFADMSTTDAAEIMRRIEALEAADRPLTIYPDAEDYINRHLMQRELSRQSAAIRKDPDSHPLRTELLDATLLPYQLDGIAFAVGAGRAILADDMGLGKTIQGIGVAELLAQWADIRRVLVICPASLKSQWRSEVMRFCNRDVQLVLGNAAERAEQYRTETFFTVCNYEQVLRDLTEIETVDWDLIILDEGQRIKNWESKTSNMIRSLSSPYRLVLSGTPLENNLGELFTVTRFVDDHRLGSALEFFNRHRVVDDRGKTIGYRQLDQLRERMQPILLRRTRGEVAKQLPERMDEIVRVTPTEEQQEIHDGQMQIVAQIVHKKFLTEMDLLRLRRALAMARMSCDSTFLVNQEEPEYSSKLERLHELLDGLIADPSRKIVLFSEWKRMLNRVERRLDTIGCEYVRLDGDVPQKKRPAIVKQFQEDASCRVILMSNAGSTGLNLQSANVVINCDLPWNPAILEQRIARAHRMGQKNPVHIYNMVSAGTIEEQLLDTLQSKQALADASINFDSEIEAVSVTSGTDDLRRRLEKMLLPQQPAPVDVSNQRQTEAEVERLQRRREDISMATGNLVQAALSLAGNLVAGSPSSDRPDDVASRNAQIDRLTAQLSETIETDAEGRPQIKITLSNPDSLRSFATILANLLPTT